MRKKGASQKFSFLEALFVAILIFGMGFLAGIWLEGYRASKVEKYYLESELYLLDLKSTEGFVELVECNEAVYELIKFADRIYEEAKILDRYEDAKRLTNVVTATHGRYDLLRVSLFLNAMKTKQRCSADYHIITYFYDYIDTSLEKRSKQNAISTYLTELKKSRPQEEIILIPIAGDNNLMSVDALMKKYGIEELPTVMVDEELQVTEIEDLHKIEEALD